MGQQWSVKEEGDDDELAIFAGRTRFVSTRRLPKSKQSPEGVRASGFAPYSSHAESSSVPPLYRPEGSSSSVDRWGHTERDQLHYPIRPAEYTNASVQPQIIPQWRPPRRSHYPYTPQQHPPPPPPLVPTPAPQHAAHEHSTVTTPSYTWTQPSSGVASQFSSATYSTASASQSHGYPGHHSHAYEPSSSATPTSAYQQQHPQSQASSQQPQAQSVQSAAPSELTELGLVSQESRLDERWTSFMRDSGYFEGFGYRNR